MGRELSDMADQQNHSAGRVGDEVWIRGPDQGPASGPRSGANIEDIALDAPGNWGSPEVSISFRMARIRQYFSPCIFPVKRADGNSGSEQDLLTSSHFSQSRPKVQGEGVV